MLVLFRFVNNFKDTVIVLFGKRIFKKTDFVLYLYYNSPEMTVNVNTVTLDA